MPAAFPVFTTISLPARTAVWAGAIRVSWVTGLPSATIEIQVVSSARIRSVKGFAGLDAAGGAANFATAGFAAAWFVAGFVAGFAGGVAKPAARFVWDCATGACKEGAGLDAARVLEESFAEDDVALGDDFAAGEVGA